MTTILNLFLKNEIIFRIINKNDMINYYHIKLNYNKILTFKIKSFEVVQIDLVHRFTQLFLFDTWVYK